MVGGVGLANAVSMLVPLFFSIISTKFGLPCVQAKHLWSCENSPKKYQWIRRVANVDLVFKDICSLGKGFAEAWDKTCDQEIFRGTLFTSVFSCKSVSYLNRLRAFFTGCISSSVGSTGCTFLGVAPWLMVQLARA